MEYVGADWIHLDHNNKTWRVLANTVLKGQFTDQ